MSTNPATEIYKPAVLRMPASGVLILKGGIIIFDLSQTLIFFYIDNKSFQKTQKGDMTL